MRRFVFLAALCFSGCINQAYTPPPEKIDYVPIQAEPAHDTSPATEETSQVSVELDGNFIQSLRKWGGDKNQITLRDALTLSLPGKSSIAIPAGASISYAFGPESGVISFNNPKPIVTTWAGPIKIHPILERIRLLLPNKAAVDVTELGGIHTKAMILDWVDQPKASAATCCGPESDWTPPIKALEVPPPPIEKPAEIVQPLPKDKIAELVPIPDSKPVVLMFAPPWCGACPGAKRDIATYEKNHGLPFKLTIKTDERFFPRLTSYPAFCVYGLTTNRPYYTYGFSNTSNLIGWINSVQKKDKSDFERERKLKDYRSKVALTPEYAAELAKSYTTTYYEKELGQPHRTSPEHLTDDHRISYACIRPFLHDRIALNRIHGWCHVQENEATKE